MTAYADASPVREIAEKLIADVPDHMQLAEVRVDYVFRDKAAKSKGKLVLGSARTVTGLNAHLANPGGGPFYVIEIALDTWLALTDAQQQALVDHELMHCQIDVDDDGMPVLGLRGHDIEEFSAVVDRHGFWKSDVARFGSSVAEQLSLAIDDAARFDQNLGSAG